MVRSNGSISILASDVSRQRRHRISGLDRMWSVGEVVDRLSKESRLSLDATDATGRTLTYHARLEREGRFLHGSEMVGESLEEGDEIILQPYITAGRA